MLIKEKRVEDHIKLKQNRNGFNQLAKQSGWREKRRNKKGKAMEENCKKKLD